MGKEHISDISVLSAENLNDLNRRRRITYIASTAGFMITILIAFVLTVYILSVSSVFSAAYYSDDVEMKNIDVASIRTGKYLGIPWIVLIPALVLVPITFVISIMRAGEFGQNGKIKLNWFDKIFSDIQLFLAMIASTGIVLSDELIRTWIYRSHLLDKPIAAVFKQAYNSVPNNEAIRGFIEENLSSFRSSGIFIEPHWVQLVLSLTIAFVIFFLDIMTIHSLSKKIKSGEFLKRTILGYILTHTFKLAGGEKYLFAKIIGGFIFCTLLAATGWGAFIVLILIFIFVPVQLRKYAELKRGIREVKAGNYDYNIPIYSNGELDRLSMDINSIADAQEIVVANELHNQRLKSELISHVSHDLRTPLTSMVSYLDLLRFEGLDSEKAPEYLDIITDKTNRLSKLTDDLFEAAKISSGDIPVELTKIEMVSLVRQAIAEEADAFKNKDITPVMNTNLESAFVYADGQQLWRVIDNLFTNVCKYSVTGSRAYINLYDVDTYYVVEIKNVSNSPLNINPDELMERFRRGDRSRNTDGSGLGLSIAKDLVKLMHGKFEIEIDGDLFKASVYMKKA
ncbi:MAG: HAMP domain-containing histidine kinase [[Eubacterium] sulci]|nr:HAMP domain-containing histidine kinase [[Eubacterium] sulci]